MYKSLKEVFGKKKSYEEIFAPVSGKCVPMGQVNDPTFSQEILGKGVAIIPSEGKEYFTSHVKAGDKVKKGDLLIEFDMDKIKEQGYDLITPIIVCNTPDYPELICHTGADVKTGDRIMELRSK